MPDVRSPHVPQPVRPQPSPSDATTARPRPDRPPARGEPLLAALRGLVASTGGRGGAILQSTDGGSEAEVVVGIGGGVPTRLAIPDALRAFTVRNVRTGSSLEGGRLWSLDAEPDATWLYIAEPIEPARAHADPGSGGRSAIDTLRLRWSEHLRTAPPLEAIAAPEFETPPEEEPCDDPPLGSDPESSALPGPIQATAATFEDTGGSSVLASAPSGASEEGLWADFPEIVGRSPALTQALSLVARVAATRVSVLILGESGTGKELIGRAIHRLSRRTGRFVSENCAAISDSLLEAELFGTVKGAYTGADRSRVGLIEEAAEGTLFLDEIAEMGPGLQSKLLRVLQEREVRRVGSSKSTPVDFRLISATHRDLERHIDEGHFRSDLLFRIDVVRIELPPLRARVGDVPILARHFLAAIARAHGRPVPPIDPRAIEQLERCSWPGNVRELRNEMERAFALSPDRIGPDSLSPRIRQGAIPHPLSQQIRDQIGCDLTRLERVVCGGMVQEVLRETNGNKAEAARRLGIPKTNLYRRLERYGIREPRRHF